MIMLTPEKLPVSVYRWDDVDAPKLDRTANCVSTIFKACLVTGYGTKQGAGWSMPFEDLQAGVKVFRPPVSAEQDFYLRLSQDSGRELTAQVYLNMTDINTGDLKLQCNTSFKYAKTVISGKWILIATQRHFWFLTEQFMNSDELNRRAVFFTCGDTVKNDVSGEKAIILHHSGGTFNESYSLYDSPLSATQNTSGDQTKLAIKVYIPSTQVVYSIYANSAFNGSTNFSDALYASPLFISVNKKIYQLAGIYASSKGGVDSNFTIVDASFDNDDKRLITFSMSSTDSYYSNFLFDTLRVTY